MKIIDHNGHNYICAGCGRVVRMIQRSLEEVISGVNERWIHHDDQTDVCQANPHQHKKPRAEDIYER